MMISTKGRYALRVLVDMAEHPSDGYIPLKDIARRQEISEKYLESIVRTLVQAQILEGLRGKGGGYRLKKPPEQYTAAEILRAAGPGGLSGAGCGGLSPGGPLPDAAPLGGPAAGHGAISQQLHPGRPDAPGSGRAGLLIPCGNGARNRTILAC